jgi:hypothetical protein
MRFLKLASNLLDRGAEDPFVWPYWIDVSLDGPEVEVVFAEGVAHGSAGGVFTLDEALSSQWRSHFQRAEGEWLRPYLEQIAEGRAVDEAELVAAFTERHGRAPEHYNWDR